MKLGVSQPLATGAFWEQFMNERVVEDSFQKASSYISLGERSTAIGK